MLISGTAATDLTYWTRYCEFVERRISPFGDLTFTFPRQTFIFCAYPHTQG